jgi:hypothetical protein
MTGVLPGVPRFRDVLPGIAAVLLAACGATSSASTTAGRPSPSGSPESRAAGQGVFGAGVTGKIVQLTATQLQLNGQGGSATVDYAADTPVLQTAAGSLSDVSAGVCVAATGQPAAGGVVDATILSVMLNMNGQCTGAGLPGGGVRLGGSPLPGASPRPRGSPGALGGGTAVRGKVTAVSGSSLTVQPATGSPVTVDVTSSTRITRIEQGAITQLAVGQCVTASGQRDATGAVQARQITVFPAGPAGCVAAFGGRFSPAA